jgi:hypothetical protein
MPKRGARLVPSVVMPANGFLPVLMDPVLQSPSEATLVAIAIRVATYTRQLTGDARVTVQTKVGASHSIPVSLADARDNEYMTVDLSRLRLLPEAVHAVLLHAGEEADFSLWETASDDGRFACVALRLADGSTRLTPGCPLP